jgi:hypothetical protein
MSLCSEKRGKGGDFRAQTNVEKLWRHEAGTSRAREEDPPGLVLYPFFASTARFQQICLYYDDDDDDDD